MMIIALLTSVQVVNMVVETKSNAVGVSMVGLSDKMITDATKTQWSIITPKGIQHVVSIYENYNIPPLPKHMDIMPSSRRSMSCCSNRDRTLVTCFGGIGIGMNKEVNLSKADKIKSNNANLYSYQVLDEYWQWGNLNYEWKRLPSSSIVHPGTYYGGCWTDSEDNVWFGGGLVIQDKEVVVDENSFHRQNHSSLPMPRLARFAHWTDNKRGFMYLFGGIDPIGRYSNEILRRSASKISPNSTAIGNWIVVTDSSKNNIEPRVGTTVFQHDNTIYLFGGQSKVTECFGDLWMFDDKRLTLLYGHSADKLIPNHRAPPQHPGCRKYAVSQLPSVGKNMFKFRGGQSFQNVTMMDTWAYSLTRSKWIWYDGSHHGDVAPFQNPLTKATPVLPSMHQSAHWTDHLNREYYFGGCTDSQCKVIHNWVWSK
jgi:hypothetical protein